MLYSLTTAFEMKVYLICGVKVEFLDWNKPIFAKNLNKKKKKNLPKIGRLSFFHYPPGISTTPPSPEKLTQSLMGMT